LPYQAGSSHPASCHLDDYPAPRALRSFPTRRSSDLPAVPVAVKVTGLPARPAAVAVRVLVPAVELKVHEVAAAIPSVPVVTGVVSVAQPSHVPTPYVTATPQTL